jgi:hypothetical protein
MVVCLPSDPHNPAGGIDLHGDILVLIALHVGLDSRVGLDTRDPLLQGGPTRIHDTLGAFDDIRAIKANGIVNGSRSSSRAWGSR